ncbi:dTDP-glucose 4,6-dehydratase [plant metagenome]|uniref:dTDP-glucose 4,6-dehydratase n=1 Tax=plant metagenome TaxID=1297885 RepID=A0A484UZ91_9ZZZZ
MILVTVRAYWLGLPGATRQAFRFLHVSTDEVYGALALSEPAFTECSPYRPNSPYAATKAASVLEAGVPGATYNVGGNSERTNLSVVRQVCQVLDAQQPRASGASHADLITFVEDRPGHDRRYAIDASKIRRELGWQPAKAFEQGLAETVDWYLANRDWIDDVIHDAGARHRALRL